MAETTEKRYGVGLVGAGGISPSHLAAYGALGRLRPVAVADIDPRRLELLGQKHFFPFATRDYRELLDRHDIDVIDVCTPPGTHGEIVRHALEAGKYVICEKPLAPTLEETDRLIEFARRFPGKLSTVFQRRFHPPIQKLVAACAAGEYGKLVAGRFTRYARGQFARQARWWGDWTIAGGGTVMTQFIHELDLMCLVFGKPRSVSATLDTLVLELDSEDTFAATVRFDGGAIVSCNSLVGADRSDVSFEIVGTTKLFRQTSAEEGAKRMSRVERLRDIAQRGFGRVRQRLRRSGPPTTGGPRGGGTHRPYFEAVLSALDGGQPLPIPPEEARPAVELATAIYTAGLTGQTVRLPLNGTSIHYAGVTTDAYRARSTG